MLTKERTDLISFVKKSLNGRQMKNNLDQSSDAELRQQAQKFISTHNLTKNNK